MFGLAESAKNKKKKKNREQDDQHSKKEETNKHSRRSKELIIFFFFSFSRGLRNKKDQRMITITESRWKGHELCRSLSQDLITNLFLSLTFASKVPQRSHEMAQRRRKTNKKAPKKKKKKKHHILSSFSTSSLRAAQDNTITTPRRTQHSATLSAQTPSNQHTKQSNLLFSVFVL